ncbi:MAG: hypothetical protein ABIK07_09615 [Planctomycetota bacterium]
MSRVFRPPKRTRNEAILLLVSFTFGFSGFGVMQFLEAPPDRRLFAIPFAALLLLFPGGISLWALLIYRRAFLSLQNGTVISQHLFSRQQLQLQDVVTARWRLMPLVGLSLSTAKETVVVDLNYFQREDQLWLIQYFRNQVPPDKQQDWPRFCWLIAMRLKKQLHPEVRIPGPHEIFITRRRYDRMVVPLTIISALIGIGLTWWLQNLGFLAFPIAPVAFWLLMRFQTPKKGYVQPRIWGHKESRDPMIFITVLGLTSMLYLIARKFDAPEPTTFLWFCSFLVLSAIAFTPYLMRSERERKQRETIRLAEAMREWDADQTAENA